MAGMVTDTEEYCTAATQSGVSLYVKLPKICDVNFMTIRANPDAFMIKQQK